MIMVVLSAKASSGPLRPALDFPEAEDVAQRVERIEVNARRVMMPGAADPARSSVTNFVVRPLEEAPPGKMAWGAYLDAVVGAPKGRRCYVSAMLFPVAFSAGMVAMNTGQAAELPGLDEAVARLGAWHTRNCKGPGGRRAEEVAEVVRKQLVASLGFPPVAERSVDHEALAWAVATKAIVQEARRVESGALCRAYDAALTAQPLLWLPLASSAPSEVPALVPVHP